MQYTQQQYKEAIDKAIAAGDRQSAEELAEIAAEIYGPYKQPRPMFAPEMAARETLGRHKPLEPVVQHWLVILAVCCPNLLRLAQKIFLLKFKAPMLLRLPQARPLKAMIFIKIGR